MSRDKRYPSQEQPRYQVRFPQDLKRFIEERAAANHCSQNSEIIRRLDESRRREESQAQKQ